MDRFGDRQVDPVPRREPMYGPCREDAFGDVAHLMLDRGERLARRLRATADPRSYGGKIMFDEYPYYGAPYKTRM